MALSKPLELPGEWDVALIGISYPYNWTNLNKNYLFMKLLFDQEDNGCQVLPFEPDYEK